MEWPPQSPDLNIIESLWDYLDQKKERKAAKIKGGTVGGASGCLEQYSSGLCAEAARKHSKKNQGSFG